MSIETTMHVHETTLDLIRTACDLTGTRRNAMIVHLLKLAMTDRKLLPATGCRIRYQQRDCRSRWRTIHVRFHEDEADYAKDLRNFLKLSDSLILALAARAYLGEIARKSRIGSICKRNDNYRFSNYVITREISDGIIMWKIYWGYPQNLEGCQHL